MQSISDPFTPKAWSWRIFHELVIPRSMATTLTKILLHITFSTYERRDLIPETVEAELAAYIGGICNRMGSKLIAMGGTANHVHLVVNMGKLTQLADLMLNIKRDTSKWCKGKKGVDATFKWQSGYFAFSVGESAMPALLRYVANQKIHHARIDFRDEMRSIMKKYDVEWDERFVWS
jgi:REP element-mobilizing transposase RayT